MLSAKQLYEIGPWWKQGNSTMPLFGQDTNIILKLYHDKYATIIRCYLARLQNSFWKPLAQIIWIEH